MRTDLFDFELPRELIAQVPAPRRPESRLLVFDRASGGVSHLRFDALLDIIPAGDLLVLNCSRVVPARIFTSPSSGKPGELLFLRKTGPGSFAALVRPGRKFKPGSRHQLRGGRCVLVERVLEEGLREVRLDPLEDPVAVFREFGEMPLPPYITSRESSPDRYQTVYATTDGSVAAPTAGLHFDQPLLDALRRKGVLVGTVLLHVGLGTFKPIETDEIEDHFMHEEEFCIDSQFADQFRRVREGGGRIWACGTTAVRTLESAILPNGTIEPGFRRTSCFIRPGHSFRAVDHLITNFHLPRSSLLVLVSAFAGRERTLDLYRTAVDLRYRFFSFGDAMVMI